MSQSRIEDRVAALEREVERLKAELPEKPLQTLPWWKKVAGTFAESEGFEEAMRLGREYRESLRPANQAQIDQD